MHRATPDEPASSLGLEISAVLSRRRRLGAQPAIVALCLATMFGCAPAAPVVDPTLNAPTATSSPAGYTPLRMTPEEATARMSAGENILIVDIRPVEAFRDEHVTGAINVPWKDLPEGHAMLPRDRLLLLYCT